MLIDKNDLFKLVQKDIRILDNLTNQLASATYMLQQILELYSYRPIDKKIALWILIQMTTTGKEEILIPQTMTRWVVYFNISRKTLHRELKKLEEKGDSFISFSSN